MISRSFPETYLRRNKDVDSVISVENRFYVAVECSAHGVRVVKTF